MNQHTLINVFSIMMLQIMRDYTQGIPDYKSLTMQEIRFFYDGLRAELKKANQPPKSSK